MNILYLDCSMGAAGDMLTAALLELVPHPEEILEKLNGLGLPGVQVEARRAARGGISGTQVDVTVNGHGEEEEHHHHHHHATPRSLTEKIEALPLPASVRRRVERVYGRIARAESEAHGCSVEEIHFHEVGDLDALADVAAVCLLMDALRPDAVVVSPICVGAGTVRCAHGVLPVPAPATANLLTGAPIYGSDFPGELCTPTGAALVMEFATSFGPLPPMTLRQTGVGVGHKEFPRPNVLRACWGSRGEAGETIYELQCDVDDMTAEAVAFACERIFEAGALDVSTQPLGMKKSRPGTLLRALCREERRAAVTEALFRHTTTLGVREAALTRYTLERTVETVETALGPVRKKISRGFGVTREKWEYEDLAALAREKGLSLAEVRARL